MLAYMLDTVLIAVLQRDNLVGTLAGVFNLLPGLHFFLLQQGNTVSQQVGVVLNPTTVHKHE